MSKVQNGNELSRRAVRSWMRRHLEEHRECRTGDVNLTALCEAAADAFDVKDEGGPLDDGNHWIWNVAYNVMSEFGLVEGALRYS
jgi:hypothetical protein